MSGARQQLRAGLLTIKEHQEALEAAKDSFWNVVHELLVSGLSRQDIVDALDGLPTMSAINSSHGGIGAKKWSVSQISRMLDHHDRKHGRKHGSGNHRRRQMTPAQVKQRNDSIRADHANGATFQELSERHLLTRTTIKEIVEGMRTL